MPKLRRVYLLSPKNLSPETIAVAFAKTSRSPLPFDAIAAELSDETSAEFHEKWVVGYGHSSVAEHAVLHVALENVSRLAIETIEGNRLASYTEKSTRYQQWHSDDFYLPSEIENSPCKDHFLKTCQNLFATYASCLPRVQAYLREHSQKEDNETSGAFDRRMRTAAIDVCRFLLPAASLANVGVTMNARSLEYAICKLLSSPLAEVRQIGEEMLKVGQKETPTLIKYAGCMPYMIQTREQLQEVGKQLAASHSEPFTLIDHDAEGELQILAAILFRHSWRASFADCRDYVESLTPDQKLKLAQTIMADRGRFDQPLREFEYAHITCEATMDQGAYFEFKRHRMMTQTVQPLTATLGFTVPKAIDASGCGEDYRQAMRTAASLYQEIGSIHAEAAAYCVPNGFNRRILFSLNLRQAFNLCRLRAAKNAHFSIRMVAYRMADSIQKVYPILGQFLDLPDEDSAQKLEGSYFSSICER